MDENSKVVLNVDLDANVYRDVREECEREGEVKAQAESDAKEKAEQN